MTTIAPSRPTGPGVRLPTSPSVGLTFVVRGIPAPQGSKRAFRNKYTDRIHMVESSKRVGPWRSDVRDAIDAELGGAGPMEGPVVVNLWFHLPRPKGHFGTGRNARKLRSSAPEYPTTKPDVDKLVRAVLDALKGKAWIDDSQVVEVTASKTYNARPGLIGVVRPAP